MTRWQLATAADPDGPLGTIEFTRDGDGADAGRTAFVPEPAGVLWMTIIEELVAGRDFEVLVDGEMRGGPHDRDRRQLEAALRQVPRQFPHLLILGLAEEIDSRAREVSPAVEATKELVRERFAAAWEVLPAASRGALEAPRKAIVDAISRAADEADLWASFEQALGVITQGDAGLVAFVEPVIRTLDGDAVQSTLSGALRSFCAAFFSWQLSAPRVIH